MARQLLLEGSCRNSGLAQIARVATCKLEPRELKTLSRGAPLIFLGIQVLEQLVNCFLKALVRFPDFWQSGYL